MNTIKNLSKINKSLAGLTLIFLFYGYLCRLAPIYFFWESKTIGWTLFFISLISILFQWIKTRKAIGKKTIWQKIIIGVVIFILMVQSILFIVIPQTAIYRAARQFILTNKDISEQVGGVTGLFLIPVGGVSVSWDSSGKWGNADLNFIVKGKNIFREYNLQLIIEPGTDWKVVDASY